VSASVIRRLESAELEVVGRFERASNATLLVRMRDEDRPPLSVLAAELGRPPGIEDLEPRDLAVYKPQRGEAPLSDYPVGTLHRREVAAWLVSEALGWGLVPATILRSAGPFGVGSLQRFVEHDPDEHYFALRERTEPEIHRQLAAMVLFDLVIDNGDRKAGHVLLERPAARAGGGSPAEGIPIPGRVRLVDHGVAFHVEHKLRTVAWDLAGDAVPGALRADLDALREVVAGEFGAHLARLLAAEEVAAFVRRVAAAVDLEHFPSPEGDRRPYPWPLW